MDQLRTAEIAPRLVAFSNRGRDAHLAAASLAIADLIEGLGDLGDPEGDAEVAIERARAIVSARIGAAALRGRPRDRSDKTTAALRVLATLGPCHVDALATALDGVDDLALAPIHAHGKTRDHRMEVGMGAANIPLHDLLLRTTSEGLVIQYADFLEIAPGFDTIPFDGPTGDALRAVATTSPDDGY